PFSMTRALRGAGSSICNWIWAGPDRRCPTTPVASMWPVTRCPPRRSPSRRDLSKFTRSPTFFKGKVVRARVSGETSKLAAGGAMATTVRQAPATATDSPRLSSAAGNGVLTVTLSPSARGVSPTISPTPSTNPVNMRPILKRRFALRFYNLLATGETLPKETPPGRLSHRHLGAEEDVLDGVEELHPFLHGTLEGLAPGDQPHAPGPFVDHRGAHRLGQVVLPGAAAGIDEPGPAHEAVGHLIAAHVDGVGARQLGIDQLIGLAEFRQG